MGIFGPGQLFCPRWGVTKSQATQESTDDLVGALSLTVSLGMKPRREADGRTDKTAKLPPELWRELRSPIRNDVWGKWILKTWVTIIWAVSLAEGSLGRGIKCAALENRSTTVRMTVLPADEGRPVIKSRATWDQGRDGMGRGLSRPAGGELLDFVWAQTVHEAIKRRASRSRVGHQNRWRMAESVPLTPGWTVNLEEWAHWSTAKRAVTGTKRRFLGTLRGTTERERARLTSLSIPQIAAPITRPGENDPLGSRGSVWGLKEARKSVGFYVLRAWTKRNSEIETTKNKAQRAWRALAAWRSGCIRGFYGQSRQQTEL